MKSTTKCNESKCSGVDAVEQMSTVIGENSDLIENKTKTDRKDTNPKIKFALYNEDEPNYQTPISCKLNKLMMCFKSEPDLSRAQNISETEPVLNRGRFIAKKLLSGVSMINLRRPHANGIEKTVTTVTESTVSTANDIVKNAVTIENAVYETPASHYSILDGPVTIENAKIDDDDEDFVDDEEVDREYDDSVDKENQTPIQAGTISYMAKLKQQQQQTVSSIGCNVSDAIGGGGAASVSPITKSTHHMSKAMQVMKIISAKNELPLKY